MNKQYGLSLIELMIAVLISCILILGVTQIFGTTTQTDKINSAIARVQESGRIALEVIGEDVRRAGYQGCSSAANTTIVDTVTFPGEAVSASDKSMTLHFATTDDTLTPKIVFADRKTCKNGDLYLKTVVYNQCINGTSLCMNGEAILDNAIIESIAFAVFTSDKTKWVDSSTITAAQLEDVKSVRVSLTISDQINKVTRTFSNTYELRNRLL